MPESMFSMAGIDVQHRSELVFTFDRNRRSRWAGIRIGPQMRRINGKVTAADRSGALILLAHTQRSRVQIPPSI
jgi:hypothetical protein